MTLENKIQAFNESCIPEDIRNNLDYRSYRLLDENDKVVAYFERDKETKQWICKTEEYKQWQKETEEFIKKNGKLGAKKKDKSQNRPATNEDKPDDMEELLKAQQLLADLMKKGGK